MGRGLSDQQRTILALAVAVNASRRGGVPGPESLVMRADPGVVDRDGDRLRLTVAFAPALPDIHEQYVLGALYGFKVREADFGGGRLYEHWWPSTVKPGKRLSVRRALSSLVDRGLLVHAWPPGWFRLLGYNEAECKRWMAVVEPTRKGGNGVHSFWFGHVGWGSSKYARAYWLQPEAFVVVGDLYRDWMEQFSLSHFMECAMVREDRGGLPKFWESGVVVDAVATG